HSRSGPHKRIASLFCRRIAAVKICRYPGVVKHVSSAVRIILKYKTQGEYYRIKFYSVNFGASRPTFENFFPEIPLKPAHAGPGSALSGMRQHCSAGGRT